eukprot:gene8892-11995_t
MNTRQLVQGLKPTEEFAKEHTFKTFKQFPELRCSVQVINKVISTSKIDEKPEISDSSVGQLSSQLSRTIGIDGYEGLSSATFGIGSLTNNNSITNTKKSFQHKRKKYFKSTHILDELSQSCVNELNILSDYRKILMSNRRKNNDKHLHKVVTASQLKQIEPILSNEFSEIMNNNSNELITNDSTHNLLSNQVDNATVDMNEEQINSTILRSGSAGTLRAANSLSQKWSQSNLYRNNSSIERTEQSYSLLNRSNDSIISMDPTSASPLEIANAKLTKIALTFDSQSSNNHLAGFDGAKLKKNEFRTLLRRCLNINLRNVEFEAFFQSMDADGSELIDGVEFVRYFFMLGNKARREISLDGIERLAKKEKEEKRREVEEKERIKKWESSQISHFTSEERDTALLKLSEAAYQWDAEDVSVTKGFEAYLTPYEFKLQLEKSLHLKLSGSEVGALIHEFTTRSGENCVDGILFIKKLISIQRKAFELEEEKKVKFKLLKQQSALLYQCPEIFPKALGR